MQREGGEMREQGWKLCRKMRSCFLFFFFSSFQCIAKSLIAIKVLSDITVVTLWGLDFSHFVLQVVTVLLAHPT